MLRLSSKYSVTSHMYSVSVDILASSRFAGKRVVSAVKIPPISPTMEGTPKLA